MPEAASSSQVQARLWHVHAGRIGAHLAPCVFSYYPNIALFGERTPLIEAPEPPVQKDFP